MKKLISVFLCIALLFSLAVISFADEESASEPIVEVKMQGFLMEETTYAVFVHVSISDVTDFEKCELAIAISEPSYTYVKDLTENADYNYGYTNCNAKAESLSPTDYRLTLQADAASDKYYAAFLFESSATVDFHASVSDVALHTQNGEIANFSLVISDQINIPVLTAESGRIYMDFYENVEDPQRYICLNLSLEKCPSFESFEILITFNPEVLAYTPEYPFMPDGEMNSISCNLVEEGKLQVIGTPSAAGVLRAFEPICLQVINDGETNIEMTLVSWKDADGEVENGKFIADFENFYALTCESYRQLTAPPTAVLETNGANVWWVPENMTVAQFLATAPTDMVDIFNADEEKLAQDDIIATGCEYKITHPGQFFNISHLIVKYDLNCDGLVTSADARLALRFAVGLEKANKEQLYAAKVNKAYEFTSDIARTILRYSVGLEP